MTYETQTLNILVLFGVFLGSELQSISQTVKSRLYNEFQCGWCQEQVLLLQFIYCTIINNWKFNRDGEWVWSPEVPIGWISEVTNNEGSKSYIVKLIKIQIMGDCKLRYWFSLFDFDIKPVSI